MKRTTVITAALALCAAAALADGEVKASAEYPEFYGGDDTKGIDFIQSIRVLTPGYCTYCRGDTLVMFEAPGMTRAIARCWQQPAGDGADEPFGHDAVLAVLDLDASGEAEFTFHADEFPNGPVNIRIQAVDGAGHQDYCELQLFNLGGVKWRQGIPAEAPPGAEGMRLVFQDDFDGPLSISADGRGARYASHKTGGGDFSGWPFSDPFGPNLPFGQRGTFLRIHASKPANLNGGKGCTGILSSIRADGSGVSVPVPFYMECRYTCQSAPGTWSAFWTLTKNTIGMDPNDPKFKETQALGCDELDVIESYGGYGPRNPNHGGHYGVTSHFWGQDATRPDWSREKIDGKPNPGYIATHRWFDGMSVGGRSAWSWTFHTYGLRVDETNITYYCDNFEVLRHPTNPSTLKMNTWFLINYAIGGISGWPIDMERYGNQSDMWVDWVRVYCGAELPEDFGRIPAVGVPGSVGVNFVTSLSDATQVMGANDIAGAGDDAQKGWNNVLIEKDRELKGIRNAEGADTPVSIKVTGEAGPQLGEAWGFAGADAKLKRGNAASNPMVEVRGVPFAKYDLVVHMGAGIHNVQGDVGLARASGERIAAFAFNYGWNGGKFVECTRAAGTDSPDPDTVVVFRGLTDPDVKFGMRWRSGKGWSGVSGFQLIPR